MHCYCCKKFIENFGGESIKLMINSPIFYTIVSIFINIFRYFIFSLASKSYIIGIYCYIGAYLGDVCYMYYKLKSFKDNTIKNHDELLQKYGVNCILEKNKLYYLEIHS